MGPSSEEDQLSSSLDCWSANLFVAALLLGGLVSFPDLLPPAFDILAFSANLFGAFMVSANLFGAFLVCFVSNWFFFAS